MSRNTLLETGAVSEVQVTATGFQPTTTYLINEGSVKWSILAHLKSQPRGKNFQAQTQWSVLAHIILEPTKIPKTHLK